MFAVYHVEGFETGGVIPVVTFYDNEDDAMNWTNDLIKQGFKFVATVNESTIDVSQLA